MKVKYKGEKQTIKEYYCLAKVGGKWYLLDDDGDVAENINDAAEAWEKEASSSKKNSDDDD